MAETTEENAAIIKADGAPEETLIEEDPEDPVPDEAFELIGHSQEAQPPRGSKDWLLVVGALAIVAVIYCITVLFWWTHHSNTVPTVESYPGTAAANKLFDPDNVERFARQSIHRHIGAPQEEFE